MPGSDTHCPYCALQCAMTITATPALEVVPRRHPANRGGLCQKGWTSAAVVSAPDRLTSPMLRCRGSDPVPVTWEVALDHIAARVRDIQALAGPDAVAVFGGGGLTNEKAYQLGKFARVALATRMIDYNGRFCMSSAAAAGNRAFGLDRGLPFPLADLPGADAIVLIGSNPAETMPPFIGHLDPVRRRGGLIVVDPRRTPTAALVSRPVDHLAPVPGTDLALLLGLLHALIAESLVDTDYIDSRTTGFADVAASVSAWWPERVEQVSGIPAAVVRRTARRLAAASPHRGGAGAYILTGRGAEQSTQGTATVTAAINLALALGLPGRAGSGYGCLTGQGNGQGGREHGQKADQLPGYRSIDDPDARAHIASVWGVAPQDLPGRGLPAMELLHRLGTRDGPRALFVHGSNLVVSAPNAERVTRRLRSLDLLVVCDIVPSETTVLAEVVLPVTQWAEEEGTMTNLAGHILRRRKATDPPPGVRSELWIWAELARRLGAPGAWPTEPARVYDEARPCQQRRDRRLRRHLARPARRVGGCRPRRLLARTGRVGAVRRHRGQRGGHASGLPRRFPHPRRSRPVRPGRPPPARRRRSRDGAGPPDHRPRPAALPVRRPDPPSRRTVRGGTGSRDRPAPRARRPARAEARRTRARRQPAWHGIRPRSSERRAAPRHRVHALPLGGSGSVNRVTSDAADPISGMPDVKVCAVEVSAADGSARPAGSSA